MKIRQNLLSIILSLACSAAISHAATLKFGGPIDGAQAETDSEAKGSAILILDTVEGTFDLSVSIGFMENDITAAHIHLAAAVEGDPEPPIFTLELSDFTLIEKFVSYNLSGGVFPAESMAALLAGETYVNFHTAENGGGEVRGQLVPMEMNSDSLVNFSTRGMVNAGNGKASLLIGGLALVETKTILFRMVADSLTRFGVQTSLKDTSFQVYQLPYGDLETAQLKGGNDNWKDSGHMYQIIGTGYAPAFDNESAVIMTLGEGVYTMNAESEQGAGIALVETYGIEMSSVEDFVSNASGGELAQEFTILKAALGIAGIDGFLQGPGPFTLFAPTDEAFMATFSEAELAALDATSALNLLLAHVVTGEVLASSLTDGETAMVESLDGGNLNILLNGEVVTVDEATVLEGDIVATNGIIHVTDAVLEVDAP